MRQLYFYIFAICTSASLIGQNRLTDYEGIGSNLNFHLLDYEDNKYLLEINQEDVIKVYKVANIDSKVLLHEHSIPGMYTDETPIIHGNKIFYCLYDNLVYGYNYVENIVESYSIPSGYNLQNVIHHNNQHLLSLGHTNEKDINLIIQSSSIINSVDSIRVVGFYGSHLLEEIITSTFPYARDYFLHNISTGSIDTLFLSESFYQEPTFDDGLLYFIDSSINLCSYNLITQEKEILDDTVVESDNIGTSILISNDTLIVESSNRIDSIPRYRTDLHFYNKLTSELLNKFEIFEDGVLTEFHIINDLLIGLTNSWELIILNHETAQKHSVPIRGGIWKELIKDRYVFFLNSDSWEMVLFDAVNFEGVVLDTIDYYKDYITSVGVIEGDDEVIMLLNDHAFLNNDFFSLDLNSMTLEAEESYDMSSNGFYSWAETFNMEDGIFIAQDPSFYFGDNQLNLIQGSHNWMDFKYDEVSKIVYARSKSADMVYRFVGGQLDSFEFTSIEEYIPDLNSVYYRNRDDEILRYDFSSGQNLLIDQNVDRPYFQLHNDELFYRKEQEFFKFNINSGLELVVSDLANNLHVIEKYPIDSLGNLYIPTASGILEYGLDGSLKFIKEFSFFNSINSYFNQNHPKTDLIFGNRDSLYHYDGFITHKIETGKMLSHPNLIGDDILWIYDWEFLDEETIGHSIYDLSQNSLTALTIEGTGRPYKGFELGEHKYLFFSDDSNSRKAKRHRLYKVDEDFTENNSSLVRMGNYTNQYYWHREGERVPYYFNDNLIFRFGDYFLEINKNGEYNFLNKIREQSFTTKFHNIDDHLYFLAYDPLYGRQLYGYASDFTKVTEGELVGDNFSIYPNPSSDYINIHQFRDFDFISGSFNYRIFSIDGKEVKRGMVNSKIEVQYLEAGTYFIQLDSNGVNYVGKFVKI